MLETPEVVVVKLVTGVDEESPLLLEPEGSIDDVGATVSGVSSGELTTNLSNK